MSSFEVFFINQSFQCESWILNQRCESTFSLLFTLLSTAPSCLHELLCGETIFKWFSFCLSSKSLQYIQLRNKFYEILARPCKNLEIWQAKYYTMFIENSFKHFSKIRIFYSVASVTLRNSWITTKILCELCKLISRKCDLFLYLLLSLFISLRLFKDMM